MLPSRLLTGALLLSLTACGTLSPPPSPTLVPPSLLSPCPPFMAREIRTNLDLALDYASALDWGSDCRAKHKQLADSITNQKVAP